MGSPRVTYDIDLCYRRTKENLQRLAAALRVIKPTLRNAPPDLPFNIDQQFLADTRVGPLDFWGYLEPLGGFEAIAARAFVVELASVDVKVIHIDDLITIKQHLRRPKDQQSPPSLSHMQIPPGREGRWNGRATLVRLYDFLFSNQ
jgi:hypothetical protein